MTEEQKKAFEAARERIDYFDKDAGVQVFVAGWDAGFQRALDMISKNLARVKKLREAADG